MRSYEILDADGNVLRTEDLDDTLAPTLLAGQAARLVAVDGEPLAKESRGLIGAVGLGDELPTMGETFVTEDEAAAAKAEAKAARAAAKVQKQAEAEAETAEPAAEAKPEVCTDPAGSDEAPLPS